MRKFLENWAPLFIVFGITIGAVGLAELVEKHNNTPDPALLELKATGYSDIHFVGERIGFCNPNPQYAQKLIDAKMLPAIKIEDSLGPNCTIGTEFIATDIIGKVEMGRIYCGPIIKAVPPFKNCAIFDDDSKPEGAPDDSLEF
jgi:hypothetical protein